MDFEYKAHYPYFCNVCLNLTDSCNLACKYCFVQQKPHFMSLETAKKAVDFMVNNFNKAKELGYGQDQVNLTFFGGEPTLCWDSIIVPLTAYIKEKYPKIFSLNMTTNGTLLNQDRINFLKENEIYLLLSCDGPPEVQDYNRPCRDGSKSSELVEKNIPLILKAFPDTTFRATINQDNCDKLFDSYIYAIQKGFSNAFFCPNCRETWTAENIEKLRQEVHKIFTYMALAYSNNSAVMRFVPIDRVYNDILMRDLEIFNNKPLNIDTTRNPYRCGLGTGSASIGYDGKIFGCQEQDSRDTNDYFYIGDIYSGIDIEKHSQILKDYEEKGIMFCENKEKCENCVLRRICIHDNCPSVAYDMFKDFKIRPEIDCEWHKMLFEDALIVMNMMKQENNELFKQYLDSCFSISPKEEKEEY